MEEELKRLSTAIEDVNIGNVRNSITKIACYGIMNYTDGLLYTCLEMVYSMTMFLNELEHCTESRE
jgi:hypothetical protein